MRLATTFLIIYSALFINACMSAGTPATSAHPTESLKTHAWKCDLTGYVVSSDDRDTEQLWLFLPGQTLRLEPYEDINGYKNADIRFSYEARNATLTRAGQVENCLENRSASIREDAKLRGIDFWGTGNEPPWKLELGNNLILLTTGYDQQRHEFPASQPNIDEQSRTTTYSSNNGIEQLNLVISGMDCPDSMSDETFAATITIHLNGEQLNGCGQALH
jgi:uncharacterized membrane protein